MSLIEKVKPYFDQVNSRRHNRSSTGNNYDPDKDGVLREAIIAVMDDEHIDLSKVDDHFSVTEGCRIAVMNLLVEDPGFNDGKATKDVIAAIKKELQMWAEVPVSKLDWFSAHILNLRKLGANETEVVLTVCKDGGAQQIRQVVPFSIEVVENSWEIQAKNWESVAGKESETDEVYKDERDLVFVDPDGYKELGRLRWKLEFRWL